MDEMIVDKWIIVTSYQQLCHTLMEILNNFFSNIFRYKKLGFIKYEIFKMQKVQNKD
jgi:hypothetical protein